MILLDNSPGAYDTEEAAARAYDLAALKYWGPETILNFSVCFLLLKQIFFSGKVIPVHIRPSCCVSSRLVQARARVCLGRHSH